MIELLQLPLSITLIVAGENALEEFNPSLHKPRMLLVGVLRFYVGWVGFACSIASLGVSYFAK